MNQKLLNNGIKMNKAFYIIILLGLIFIPDIKAQKTMLIKGFVIEKSTNKPVETEISIIGNSGKKYRINSNNEGEFSSGIEGGDIYEISIRGYSIPESEKTINIPKTSNYKEYSRDLHISKFASGLDLYNLNIFNKGTAVLSPSAEETLMKMRDEFAFHNLKVNFIVNTADYYEKNKKKRASSVKQLMADRIKALKDICFKLNFRQSHIDYFEDVIINNKPSKANKNQLKVVVR